MSKKHASLVNNISSLCILIGSIFLSGCGVETLDGSTEASLMESYSQLRSTVSPDKVAAFDLAFQNGRDRIADMKSKNPSLSEDEIRVQIYSDKTPAMLVNDTKSYMEDKIGSTSLRMKKSLSCRRSYEDGLKMTNITMRNSSQSPKKRIEVSFDLQNNSNYPILALQVDMTIEVFGSTDYEKSFIGDNFARCNSKSIVKPGNSGTFTCLLNYKMDNLVFDGPVEELQAFSAKIINNDSNLLDGKEEENSFASCRSESEKYKQELKNYTSLYELLNKF